jgi:LPS-assembly protein
MLLLAALVFPAIVRAEPPSEKAEQSSEITVDGLTSDSVFFTVASHTIIGTNGVIVRYGGAVLVADSVSVDTETYEASADGRVRIQQDDQTWIGEHIQYNFKTRQMVSQEFRTGRAPVFAAGRGLHGDLTNHVYTATNAFVTTDDIYNPAFRIRAKHIRIIPGKRIEATHATLYMGGVPVFYFPYYSRNLGARANNFNVLPGYRSSYGAFALGTYSWYLNDQFDGALHLDYRQERGLGGGPDVNYHLGRWGEGTVRYYYTHDDDPGTNAALNAPVYSDRQRLYFSYLGTPFTNTEVRSLVRYQSDIGVVHDFFPGEYREDPQPNTSVEITRFWRNFSLDALTEPRLNTFYETVERLPDVRLRGFRQQLGPLPLYYESDSSAGYYRRLFAETNGPVPPYFQAARADTFQQITLPETLFGWLNVAPRVGGRLTYYSKATGPGATTDEQYRTVFNTGAEVSVKAARLWPGVKNRVLDLDGLRHIIEPSINYAYVSTPLYGPNQLPQFDYQLPSLGMLPIEFPQYNSIDSIDSQNVIRFGLGNKLQTKRAGEVQDFLNWQVFADWRLRPDVGQQTFSDIYSDLSLRPRSWITLQSLTRFNPNTNTWTMAFYSVTFEPGNLWSWSIGQYYLKDDNSGTPTALGPGNNQVNSSLFYRVNENWGLRATHQFNVRNGRLQEQYYTVYRDMRSWTAALTAGLLNNTTGPDDFTIAFSFSFKAVPRFGLGRDTVRPYSLLGQ